MLVECGPEPLDALRMRSVAMMVANHHDGTRSRHARHVIARGPPGRILIDPRVGETWGCGDIRYERHDRHADPCAIRNRLVDRRILLRVKDDGVGLGRPQPLGQTRRPVVLQDTALDDDRMIEGPGQIRERPAHPLDQRQFRPGEQDLEAEPPLMRDGQDPLQPEFACGLYDASRRLGADATPFVQDAVDRSDADTGERRDVTELGPPLSFVALFHHHAPLLPTQKSSSTLPARGAAQVGDRQPRRRPIERAMPRSHVTAVRSTVANDPRESPDRPRFQLRARPFARHPP